LRQFTVPFGATQSLQPVNLPLVPRPRLNLNRFHGVFAPDFRHRDRIVPRRARRRADRDQPLAPMTSAQRLDRGFAMPQGNDRISETRPGSTQENTFPNTKHEQQEDAGNHSVFGVFAIFPFLDVKLHRSHIE
jgi:hypothetical protein